MPSSSPGRAALVGGLMALFGCRNPQADVILNEQLKQVGDDLNNARQETAVVHEQLDSLRTVVARQDTLLRQLAGMAGVQVPTR